MTTPAEYGVGIGWRPEIAGFVAALPGLRFAEVVAESIHTHAGSGRSVGFCGARMPVASVTASTTVTSLISLYPLVSSLTGLRSIVETPEARKTRKVYGTIFLQVS